MANTAIKYRVDTLEDVINKLRLDESRFINCCLLEQDQGVRFKEEVYYPVDINKYGQLGGISKGKAFSEIVAICKFHKENSLTIPVGGSAVLHTSLIYEYREDIDAKTIHINWNPKFIPYISGKMEPGRFLMIDIAMSSTSSSKKYAMYVLLSKSLWRLDREGSIILSEAEIRKGLNLMNGEYKEFNILNSKIIKPSLQEIYTKIGKNLQVRLSKGNAIFTYKVIK